VSNIFVFQCVFILPLQSYRVNIPTIYMLKVKIINRSGNALPAYATPLSAGLDLRANLEAAVVLQPLERKLIPTGLFIELPEGYEAQICPRSGLALHHGITVLNTPGTIDADYRGELSVLLINLSDTPFEVTPGERICQMVVARHEQVEWQPVEVLTTTERGAGGYGHSGKL
jgi:dUTP pyrophosphatase